MSETGREPDNFSDNIMFNEITNRPSPKAKMNVSLKREKWLLAQQDADLVTIDDKKIT